MLEPHPWEMPLLLLFIPLGLLTQLIFLYRRAWFDDPPRLRVLAAVEVALFAGAFACEHAGFSAETDFFLILKLPLLSLGLFKAMQWGFIRLFGYPPRDSFHSMDWRLLKDGLFNGLFWILSLLVPLALIFGRVL